MLELTNYISQLKRINKNIENISLSKKLEAIIGNYLVAREGGGNCDFYWLTIFFRYSIY